MSSLFRLNEVERKVKIMFVEVIIKFRDKMEGIGYFVIFLRI